MKNYLVFLFVLCLGHAMWAQEINCKVTIDAQQTGQTQLTVFKTLQSDLQDFLNNTEWSRRDLPEDQRVKANFFITVTAYSSNQFKATLQVQSSRPVYGSSMVTPIFNFMDKDFNFTYQEHQPLNFNPNSFESNLVSTMSFYVYVILGLDADTFAPDGGADYFNQADQIANVAQQSGRSGWGASAGDNSRYELSRELRSSIFNDFHRALYVYHRLGLDVMSQDLTQGKQAVVEALSLLEAVNTKRSNTLLVRAFFDAKANEVASIFKGGPQVDMGNTLQNLFDIAPNYSGLWSSIQ